MNDESKMTDSTELGKGMRNKFTHFHLALVKGKFSNKTRRNEEHKQAMRHLVSTSCPRLPTYTVVQSGLCSGFSLLPPSWLASVAAEYSWPIGKISTEESIPYWVES